MKPHWDALCCIPPVMGDSYPYIKTNKQKQMKKKKKKKNPLPQPSHLNSHDIISPQLVVVNKKAHKKHRYNYNIDCWIEVITPVNMLEVCVNLLPNPSVIFPVQQGNTAMKLSSDYKSNFRSYAAIFLHIFPSVPPSLLLISYEHLSSKKTFIQHILKWWTENVKHVLLHPSASIVLFLILW